MAQARDPAWLWQLAVAPFLLEGSALYCRLVAGDGAEVAQAVVPVEASRFRAAPAGEGQEAVSFRLEVVLEVVVPAELLAELLAEAGSLRFWEGPGR